MSPNMTTAAPRHGTAAKSSRLQAADLPKMSPTPNEGEAAPRCVVCRGRLIRATPNQRTHPLCAPEGDLQLRPAPAAPVTPRAPVSASSSSASTAPAVLDFTRFTAADWQLWHAAYVAGYLDGAAQERAEHFAPIDAAARETVRRTARTTDFASMCEVRGDHARAQAVREHWHATGLVGGTA